jgi:hypothetical protein
MTGSTSYYAGQDATIVITRPSGPLFRANVGISFVPINASLENTSPDHVVELDSSRVTTNFTLRIDARKDRGTYKVITFIGSTYSSGLRWGQSKAFELKRPLIMISMPKRNLTQGEKVDIDVYNPYFDFDYYNGYYEEYEFRIIAWNYPRNSTFTRASNLPTSMSVDLGPGVYKFGLFLQTKYESIFKYTIPNSTFRVIQNRGIVTTDKTSYRIGEKMSFSLTSSKKIPLSASFDARFSPGSDLPPYTKQLTFKEYKGAVAPTIINGTTTVDWPFPGEYRIVVRISYLDWAFSKPFNITKKTRSL